MNIALKVAIVATRTPQHEIARAIGLSESLLSRIVHGRREASPDERSKLARTLGVDERQLFLDGRDKRSKH